MELLKGRPENAENRLEKEIRVYDLLDRLGVEYEYVDHEPLMTMQDCEEVDRILDAAICKNLFLCNRQKTAFYLLMLPADKQFQTSQVSHAVNSSRLSFGGPQEMEELLGLTPGSVSVLGLMNDVKNQVQLLMDESLLAEPMIGCHPCMNTTSLRLSMKDLLDKVLKEVHHDPLFLKLSP